VFILQSFNILRYQLGQKYDSHYDAFHSAEYGPLISQRVSKQPNFVFLLRILLKLIQNYHLLILHSWLNIWMQVVTFLLFLSSVEEGGETMFPFEVIIVSFFRFNMVGILSCKTEWFCGSRMGEIWMKIWLWEVCWSESKAATRRRHFLLQFVSKWNDRSS